MAQNFLTENDEINLIELIKNIWDGKWKIAIAIIISFLGMISYQSTTDKNFIAKSKIVPVTTFQINEYSSINYLLKIKNEISKITQIDLLFEEITKTRLLNLYLESLSDKLILEDAIHNAGLLDANKFINDELYKEEIAKFASSIKIVKEIEKKDEINFEDNIYYLTSSYDDINNWKQFLTYLDNSVNQRVKNILEFQILDLVRYLTQKNKYEIEDLSVKIDNALSDYESLTLNRLTYLAEQSEIAKKLGIASNTIEVQKFGAQSTIFSNITTDNSFYLRGYEAIDKEIELIKNRKYKDAFIDGLLELKQKKRNIEQDESLNRLVLAYNNSSIGNNIDFIAARMSIEATEVEYKDYNKMYAIAVIIGLIVGVFYVLISGAIKSKTVSRKRN